MNTSFNTFFEIFAEGLKVHAEPLTERRNGTMMSDINFVIPLTNVSSQMITINSDQLHVAFKDQTGKLFFVDTAGRFQSEDESQKNTKNKSKDDPVADALDSVFSTFIDMATALYGGMSEVKVEKEQKVILKFSITVDSIFYNLFHNLRLLLISINNLPIISLECDNSQKEWKAISQNG